MDVWESLYRFILSLFRGDSNRLSSDCLRPGEKSPPSETQDSTLRELLEDLNEKYNVQHDNLEQTSNDTMTFWNCLAYIALYMAMRSSLRVAAIKEMAPCV